MSNIAILGPGAIGCAVGGALLEAAHHHIFFCANTPFDRIHLTYPSGPPADLPAEVHTTPEGLPPADWLLIAVKTYQVPRTLPWLQILVTPDTKIVVLQNGVEHRETIRPFVDNPDRILPAVVQIPCARTAPGTVELRGDHYLIVPDTPLGQSFAALSHDSRIEVRLTPDFATAAWKKLCLNAPTGSISALTERDHAVLRDPSVAALARQIILECIAVARAEGATIEDSFADQIVTTAAGKPGDPPGSNSMLYDRLAGNLMEFEARNGVIPRIGARHGIPTPISTALYALLKSIQPRH